MSEIATGVTATLLTRAADVVLKERRRLVLMIRETPLHTGHLRTMTALSEMGAVIAPPVPAFYTRAADPGRFRHPERGAQPGPLRHQRHRYPSLAGLSRAVVARAPGRHGALLFAVVLLDMIAFGIVIPILPFITPRLGGDSVDIALIIVTYSLVGAVMGPTWGRLSDRIGRKPVLMICTTGGAPCLPAVGHGGHPVDGLCRARLCGLLGRQLSPWPRR